LGTTGVLAQIANDPVPAVRGRAQDEREGPGLMLSSPTCFGHYLGTGTLVKQKSPGETWA
jgi:hypothetical protein